MITGHLPLDINKPDVETALANYHRPTLRPSRPGVILALGPAPYHERTNVQNIKLAAALGLIVTMCQCLIRHYEGKSENQKKKAASIEKHAYRLLQRQSKKMSDHDIFIRIGSKIDALNTRLGFDNQPSWMVYISFSIAILSDAFPDLNRTRIHNFKDELEPLLSSLQGLHDYLAKKEKDQVETYNAKATELYTMWEELF